MKIQLESANTVASVNDPNNNTDQSEGCDCISRVAKLSNRECTESNTQVTLIARPA